MKIRLLLGVALGALFLYLSLREVNLQETWEVIKGAKYGYFAVFAAVNLLILWLRAVRWQYLLKPVQAIPARRLLSPLCIGLMANLIFPARAGEFIRAYLVGEKEGVSKSTAFATVVVERLFDGMAIMSFLGAAPFFLRVEENQLASRIQWVGVAFCLFYVVVLVGLLILSHHREALSHFLVNSKPARRWRLVRTLFEIIRKFTEGLAVLKSSGEIFGSLALSLLIWGLAALTNYMMMYSVDINLPLYAAFFLVVIQSFGVMVPSPGYVGSYQYAHIVALSIYGIAKSEAFGLAVLIHAGYFIVFIAAGLFFLSKEHLGWGDLKEASKEKGPPDGPGKG